MLLHSSRAASSLRPARLRRLILALALLGLSALGRAASANTLTVPAQYATIQAAIDASASGDMVLISDGTYSGFGNVDLDLGGRNITVTSQNGSAVTVIDCGGEFEDHQGFHLHSGETSAVIRGLTIKNGYESGSTGPGYGGGIEIDTGASVTLQNCALTGNTAENYGGGLFNDGTATLIHCTVTGNTSNLHGGGLYSGGGFNRGGASTTTLIYCTLTDNTARGECGGLFNDNGGTATLTDCALEGNSAGGNGGALLNDGAVALTDCVLKGNTVTSGGGGGLWNGLTYISSGGLLSSPATATLTNCTLKGNTAQEYGGGLINEGKATLTNCVLEGNTVPSGNGGGLENGGTATLTDCALTGNSAYYGGGGLSNYRTVTLTDCALTGNSAHYEGGGFNNRSGAATATLTNCSLTGNSTEYKGGGFYNDVENRATLTNCSLSGNSAPSGEGGGLYNNEGMATLTNDILYGDTGGELSNDWTLISVSASHCDISGGLPSGVTDGGGNVDADPLFVSGSTPYDLHLQTGSPCLGAGTSSGAPATDFDGRTRPSPPSIGAYEGATVPSVTHLLWDNTDGRMMFWNLDAQANLVSLQGYGPYTDDGKGLWHAKALATGPDGTSRIVWNNDDSRVMLWSVDRQGALLGVQGYGPYNDDGKGLWHATAVSAGPQNQTHLLWNDEDGRVMLWSLDEQGALLGLAGYGPYTDGAPRNAWRAVSVSTGPDGRTHVLWDNADHRIALWDVAADFSVTGIAGYGPYTDDSQPGAAGNLWDGVGISVGPDNLQHVLWGNTDRRAMLWGLGGSGGIAGIAGYGPYDDDGKGLWGVTGVATGPDNVTHLLWNDDDRRVMLWGLDGVGGVTGIAGYGPYTDDSQPDAAQNLWSAVGVSAGP